MNNMKYLIWTLSLLFAIGLTAGGGPLAICAMAQPEREIREYEGKRLDAFDRAYDNSIAGPQRVDIKQYRLKVTGLVEAPQSLTYHEVLRVPIVKRAVTLYCVEGWNEHLLFEGVRLVDLLALAKPKEGVRFIIFYATDGYSSSLTYDDATRLDVMLAAKINGRVLDAKRGFPFQVVAESKLGYKWVKWVTRIELSDKPYKGFWEERGFDNEADVK
ncbi:MAG: molybdopterin-dependent oxidoreductase [Desulfobacterales bacterium]|nr:molybdopterin-dependent oxidoreductase [Desulfobacterales bacterium]